MNKKQPHALNVGFGYEILGGPKVKLKTGDLAGYITIGKDRTKITLPMRSWLKLFLTKLHNTLDGTPSSSRLAKGNFADAEDDKGILLGDGGDKVTLNDTALSSKKAQGTSCSYGTTALIAPVGEAPNYGIFELRRTISNLAEPDWYIYEMGLAVSCASSVSFISRDLVDPPVKFPGLSDIRADIKFKIQQGINGGPLLNLARLFYNLFFVANANASAFIPRSGTTTITHAAAHASSAFVVDGGSGKPWGIVVGASTDYPGYAIGIDEGFESGYVSLFGPTNLSYGANTVSSVTTTGRNATFYVTRDINNNTNATIKINRIGLLCQGQGNGGITTFQDDQIFLCMNGPTEGVDSNGYLQLDPGRTLRVTYTFSISV